MNGATPLFRAPWDASGLPAGRVSDASASDVTTAPLLITLLSAVLLGGLVVFAELNALTACLSLLACVFILRDFRSGAFLLIAILPISASPLVPHSMAGITGANPVNLLLLGTLAACLLHLPLTTLARLAPRPLVWLYLVPVVIAGLAGSRNVGAIPSFSSVATFVQFDNAGGYLRDMLLKPLLLVLFAFVVAATASRESDDRRLHNALLVAIWVMGLMTIGFVAVSGVGLAELASEHAREFFAPLGMHANTLGRIYAVAYALMLFTFVGTADPRRRLVLGLSMVMVAGALMLTFSRSAFFGFAVVNAWFLLSRRSLPAIAFAAALLAALLLAMPGAVWDRLASGWDSGLNAVSAGRIDAIWLPLMPDLQDNLLFGRGLESTLWSNALRSGSMLEVTHPHNAYLRAALDMGVVGLALLCAYFVTIWQGFRRLGRDGGLSPEERGFYTGAGVGLVSFLVAGVAGSSLTPSLEQAFLGLAIGLLYGRRLRVMTPAPATVRRV